MGKVLEKITLEKVTQRWLTKLSAKHLPPVKFGGRAGYSAVAAVSKLVYGIDNARKQPRFWRGYQGPLTMFIRLC